MRRTNQACWQKYENNKNTAFCGGAFFKHIAYIAVAMFAFLLSLDAFGVKLTFKPNASIVLNTVSTLGRRMADPRNVVEIRPDGVGQTGIDVGADSART